MPLFMERFSTTVTKTSPKSRRTRSSSGLCELRAGAAAHLSRDEVQRRNGLAVKDELIAIGDAVLAPSVRRRQPIRHRQVVVGNVQYPSEVADAVSRKLAATQELDGRTRRSRSSGRRTKREVQAAGIANAMQIIRGELSALYIQHEAIEAQKLMVNSPNHTTVYIPVGPMGVPLTGTFPAACAVAAVTVRTLQVSRQSRGRESPLPTRRNHAAGP